MLYFIFGNGFSAVQVFALIVAFCVAICIAMTSHEYAHAYVAYKNGDDTAKVMGRMTLNPLAHVSGWGLLFFALVGFGWAKPVPIDPVKFRNYKKGATWTLVSGVITNFVLAIIFCGLYMIFGNMLSSVAETNLLAFFTLFFLQFCFLLNLSLAIFNLLPIPPLDGFNLLSIWTKYENKFTQFMGQYGMFFLIIFILPLFGGRSILQLFYQFFTNLCMSLWGLIL